MDRIAQETSYALAVLYAQSDEGENAHFACQLILLVGLFPVRLIEKRVVFIHEVGEQREEGFIKVAKHILPFLTELILTHRGTYLVITLGNERAADFGEQVFQIANELGCVVECPSNVLILDSVGFLQLVVGLLEIFQMLDIERLYGFQFQILLADVNIAKRGKERKEYGKDDDHHQQVALTAQSLKTLLHDDG